MVIYVLYLERMMCDICNQSLLCDVLHAVFWFQDALDPTLDCCAVTRDMSPDSLFA